MELVLGGDVHKLVLHAHGEHIRAGEDVTYG